MQSIPKVCSIDEFVAKLTMEHLDHGTDHFADLVEKERLTFKVEANEFYGLVIRLLSDLECILVDVHKLIRSHFHHVAACSRLMRLDFLGIVVIPLSALEVSPELIQCRLLIII